MNYCFDIEVAKEYGVEEAIVIYNFQFWINKNIANRTNFMNGHYWTYNSVDALNKLFPFWSSGQIRRIIKSLIDKEVLLKEKLDCNKYNQTCWYAFKNEQKWICNSVNIDLSISANGDDENSKCKTDINHIKNTYISDDVLESENEQFGVNNENSSAFVPWEEQALQSTQKPSNASLPSPLPSSKKHKVKLTEADIVDWETLFAYWEQNKGGSKYKNDDSRKRMLKILKKLTYDNLENGKKVIFDAIDHGWQGFCNNGELYYKGALKTVDDSVIRSEVL